MSVSMPPGAKDPTLTPVPASVHGIVRTIGLSGLGELDSERDDAGDKRASVKSASCARSALAMRKHVCGHGWENTAWVCHVAHVQGP